MKTDCTKKRLIIIGNKMSRPTYNGVDISMEAYQQAIQNCDYVCRINRMHNYGITTGTKIDGLYIGGWNDYVNNYKGGQHVDVTKTAKNIFVDKRAWPNFENKCLDFITQEQKNNITICPFIEQKEHIGNPYPCSVILMIDYFATTKPWCDEYEIWVTGIDIENRKDILSNGWQWKTAGHITGAEAEEQYLKKMLDDGKIKHLEKELYCQKVEQRHIPILLVIKSFSKRCPYKNETLLPYTLEYLKRLNRLCDTTIITDGNCYRYLSQQYRVNYYIQDNQQDGDEFTAINSFLQSNKDVKEFIWLPVTQPCRDDLLIDKVLQKTSDGLVMSYTEMADRSIFKLNDDETFDIKNTERKGSMCKTFKMADGAIYYMTTERFYEIFNSENRNYNFWNGNIQFVKNEAPMVDIDTKQELLQFLRYYNGRL